MRPISGYLPNLLSISRIPLALLLVLVFSSRDATHFWLAVCLIALALLSDILDGRLARKWGLTSTAGFLLDGLGDKVFYASLLIIIAREAPSQTVTSWLLISRELILYGLRAIDPHGGNNRMFLRSVSLIYAFAIRVYFSCFLVWCVANVYDVPIPGVGYFGVIALPAIIAGYTQIGLLAKMIADEF